MDAIEIATAFVSIRPQTDGFEAELGVECPTVTRIGLAEHEKRLHAVSLNLARRHLTDAQKVLLGRTIEPDVAEAARRRQGARTDLSPTGDTSTEVNMPRAQGLSRQLSGKRGAGQSRGRSNGARLTSLSGGIMRPITESVKRGRKYRRE